jgi:two-component system NtrC family response regulator
MENVIKRAVIMAEGPLISAADLALETTGTTQGGSGPINLRQIREEAERKAIVGAMAQANGNVAQAASLLGITRPTLYDLLNRLNLR